MSQHFVKEFLYPRSVAIYGANNKCVGIGSIQLMNIINAGFKGEIFPIHPNLDNIFGFKAYKSIKDVPKTPDLVVIALPAKIVPQIFKECGEKGVKRIILISGGFREVEGKDGALLTTEICDIAKKYDIRFVGPNCLGVYNSWIYPENDSCIFNMNIWDKIKRGKFSVVSQSGTLSSHIWFDPESLDVGLGKSISVGNESNVNVEDFLEYFKDDEETNVIGLYIEEIKEGKKFFELAKKITPKKPIIAIYVGGSESGNRAIKSHTGALAGNFKIYQAMFKSAGIIHTESVEEFLDLAVVLSKSIFPKGNRLGIITNSGGPGAMIASNAEKYGLRVPEFSKPLQEKFKSLVIDTASLKNPLDCTFDLNLYNYYVSIPKVLIESGEVDAIVIYGTFGLQEVLANYLKNEKIASRAEFQNQSASKENKPPLDKLLIPPIVKLSKEYSIPIFYINPQDYLHPWSKKIRENGGILFKLWDRPICCLAKLCEYGIYRKSHTPES